MLSNIIFVDLHKAIQLQIKFKIYYSYTEKLAICYNNDGKENLLRVDFFSSMKLFLCDQRANN